MTDQYLEADVLVLGGGLAGCFAAIKAAEDGARVVLFDKANIKRSGNGGTGLHRIPLIHPDYNLSYEEFARLNLQAAAGICDEDISQEFARDTLDRVLDLESYGVKVRKDDGSFMFKPAQDIAQGNIAIWGQGPDVWHDVKPTMARKVRDLAVTVRNRTSAIGLLTEDGATGTRVIGGIGMDTRSGGFVICKAGAVVLATGGSYRVGRHKNTLYAPTRFIECGCPTNSGDGQHMAFRAGAEIVNMEFLELSPSWKDFAHWGCGPVGVVGREILGNGEPVSTSHEESTKIGRYSKSYAFGKDTEALFNDASVIQGYPENTGEMREVLEAEENEATSYGYRTWSRMRDEDYTKAPIEFEWHPPYLHNNQAGVYIDVDAAASLPGLYCAGDIIGGGWRQSSGGAFVFGARAGRSAAAYARTYKTGEIHPGQVQTEKERISGATAVHASDGYSWIELEDKARQIISEYGGPLTSDAKLARGLGHLKRIRERYLPGLYARDVREMLRVSEVNSTFWIAEAHLTCALMRKESRSPYVSILYKRNWPDQDDENWLKHSVVTNVAGELACGNKPVRRIS